MSKENERDEGEWTFHVLTFTRTVTKELCGHAVIRVLLQKDQDLDGDTPEGEALARLLDENELITWNDDSEWDDVADDLSLIDVDCDDRGHANQWACDCRKNEDGEWEID